jgi:transposase
MERAANRPELTVGLDLGDRFSRYCVVNGEGEVVEEGRVQSTEAAFARHFPQEPQLRIALECGTHSPWVSRMLKQFGHQVIVANARKIPAITASESKNDRNDAEKLARFAAFDPRLLSPVQHRSVERQLDLNLIQARATLVKARTMIVNALRGLVKSAVGRLPACSTESLPARVESAVPPTLAAVAGPLIEQVSLLNKQIAGMDQQIEKLARKYPEIGVLRSAPGVGPLVAAASHLSWIAPTRSPAAARRAPSWACARHRASPAKATRKGASPRPATAICAAC